MKTQNSCLAAHDLAFGYAGHPVGAHARLELKTGEALALLGLKTMLGLLRPLDGYVTLDGAPLRDLPVAERARAIAYVPQSHAGTFAFSVLDVVMMGRTAHGGLFSRPGKRDRVISASALERMGVSHLAQRAYTMISGGERQLVLIARALAQQPRYIVLDEPTASLDFGNQGKVMRQIADLKSDNLGVLFTTHDPNQALRYADRVALLRDGRLQNIGDSADMLTERSLVALYGHSTVASL
jgi:iron complex transport system ATP-binding protein